MTNTKNNEKRMKVKENLHLEGLNCETKNSTTQMSNKISPPLGILMFSNQLSNSNQETTPDIISFFFFIKKICQLLILVNLKNR